MRNTERNTERGPIAVVARFPSKSNPDRVYEVRIGADERVYCTCPAWAFGHGKDCRHVKAWRNL